MIEIDTKTVILTKS